MLPIRLDHRPATLIDCARELTQQSGDHTAVTLITPDGTSTLTYRAFFDQAARYAHALENAGVGPQDLVVLVLQHGVDVLHAFWGAMLLGAIPSIFPFLTPKLDPDRYYESVRALVELSEVKAVVTFPDQQPALEAHLGGIPTLGAILNVADLDPAGSIDDFMDRTPASPDDTAFLQHSSGSTGLQKGVMLSHRSVLNQVAAYSAAIQLAPDDVIASWLPLYHDMGLIAGFVTPIVQGIPLVLMSPFHWVREPAILLHAIQQHRATLCWLPNFAYSFLATRVRPSALEGLDLSSLRAVINCSEPVRADSHRAFTERYTDYGLRPKALATCYAMAENTFAVTQSTVGKPPHVDVVDRDTLMTARIARPADSQHPAVEMVSCGVPIPNTTLRVVDAERRDLPDRHVGEIALRSDCMLSGYYHRPDATGQAIADGWYFTGDLGYIADGELYITGRQKDLIINSGKNIYPQDIENALNDISGIHPGRVVAFGVPNDQLGTEDIAVVCEVETEDIEQQAQIGREIRARIVQTADVMARYVHLVGPKWLLKTSSGKVARAANRQKFLDEIASEG
ncbi:MAG TPA: fatty acyl-AMP ligase [Aggregatilinea sp.]|uniref:fatty acyl-AMP ligase n=1 Tax=Aggregatilinea sp. TaxID=2806333 RepID=UPI002C142C2F|nr:fatty acyl-AMP ligase [Aggregatilinea sp.]HML22789.1 fatty acyl-AMP ligase [Aggregatilinea sp.]